MIKKIAHFILNCFILGGSLGFIEPSFSAALEQRVHTLKVEGGAQLRVIEWKTQKPCFQPYTIVILSGFGMITDQYRGFVESFSDRGYQVWSFDWRGQGLSSRTTSIKTLGHIDSFDTHIKDLAKVLDYIQTDKPFILFGSSMGGHLALRFLGSKSNTHSIKAAIAVAPMVDIKTAPYPRWVAKALAYVMTGVGAGEKFIVGRGPFDIEKFHFDPEEFGEPSKFEAHKAVIQQYPEAAIGAPSYQWLRSAFESMDLACTKDYLSGITVPVLIIQAEHENKVMNPPQEETCRSLKRCQLIQIKNSHHSFHTETEEVLDTFWKEVDNFLKTPLIH